MPRTINEFVSAMQNAEGFARLSKFEVVITLPPRHGGTSTLMWPSNMKTVNLFCNGVSVPGHDLQTQSRQHGSEPARDIVQSHAYEGTVDATFYLSTNHMERDLMLDWLHQAVNPHTHKANYYDNYIGKMEIYQLSSVGATRTLTFDERSSDILRAGRSEGQLPGSHHERPDIVAKQKLQVPKKVWGIEVTEAYPATVGGLDYDYKSKDTIATFDVKFNFKEWHKVSDDKLRTSDQDTIDRMYTQKSYAPTKIVPEVLVKGKRNVVQTSKTKGLYDDEKPFHPNR
jgi:hypothetical protein